MSTVVKALEVLDLFSETRPTVSLSEAARLLSRDKSTAQRHLNDLCAAGLLEREPGGRGYYLGHSLTRYAMIRERTHPKAEALHRIVTRLVAESGETAHASLYANGALKTVEIVDTTFKGTRVYIDPADDLPLHATASGVAFLSTAPPDVVESVIGGKLVCFTGATPVDPVQLTSQVMETRLKGYAVARGTFEEDVVGQAAPVLGYAGEAIGAVAIAVPSARFNDEVQGRNARLLRDAAQDISRLYGGPAYSEPRSA